MKRSRKIIHIDEARCDGCGLCVPACAEGAIEIVGGKARLASDVYCDGLGKCLGECPQGAIRIEEREAEAFDEKATEERLAEKRAKAVETFKAMTRRPAHAGGAHGCPGARMMSLARKKPAAATEAGAKNAAEPPGLESRLGHWPVKMVLAPVTAPWYHGATLLIAADCAPFAYADFHRTFLSGKPLLTFCPKFGEIDEERRKLAEILRANDVRGIHVLYMEVPCCSGLARLARAAVEDSGRRIPIRRTKIGIRGDVLEEETLPLQDEPTRK